VKIVNIQKVTLTFATGDTTKDGALSGFTDVAKTVPFSMSSSMSADSQIMSDSKFDCEIVDASTVRVSRGGTGAGATVIVYVVQFDANTTVQKGNFSSSATLTTATVSSVTTAQSFVLGWWKSDDATLQAPERYNLAFELSSSTNINIRINTAGSTHTGHWYLISNPTLSVQRGISTQDATPANVTITSVDLTKSYLMWTDTTNETQYEDEGNSEGHLSSATNIEFNPGYSSGSHSYYWQVISDTELVNVQRFQTLKTTTASGTFTLSAVDTSLSVANAGHPIASNCSSEYDKAYDMSSRSTSYDLTSSTSLAWQKNTYNGSAVVEVISFALGVVSPSITDIEDELFEITELAVTITGSDFNATQGTGKVEIGNSATYASATKVQQTVASWSDTSIDINLDASSFTEVQLWVFVTADSGQTSDAYAIEIARTPTISNAEDEIYDVGETGILIDGTYFLGSQGSGKVELCTSSTYASGTKVSQTISSWSDTQIAFGIQLGATTETDLWLFVTNSYGKVSSGTAVKISRSPTVTNIEDEDFFLGETGIQADGTYFGATKGTGKVEVSDSSTYGGTLVAQTTSSWNDTAIVFDLDIGALSVGTLYVFVTNDFGKVSNSTAITVTEIIPSITQVEDGVLSTIETDVQIDGVNFGVLQGTGKVELGNKSDYASAIKVEQTVNSWGDTIVNFNVIMGSLVTGNLYLFITTDDGKTTDAFPVQVKQYAVTTGLYKNGGIVGVVNSAGFSTTVFLVKDE